MSRYKKIKISKTQIIIICVAAAVVLGVITFFVGKDHNWRYKLQDNGITASEEADLLNWWENEASVGQEGSIELE